MLADSVERFLEKNYSHELRRDMIANRQAMSEEVWQGFASLGSLGVPFSDEYGGFGGGGFGGGSFSDIFGDVFGDIFGGGGGRGVVAPGGAREGPPPRGGSRPVDQPRRGGRAGRP